MESILLTCMSYIPTRFMIRQCNGRWWWESNYILWSVHFSLATLHIFSSPGWRFEIFFFIFERVKIPFRGDHDTCYSYLTYRWIHITTVPGSLREIKKPCKRSIYSLLQDKCVVLTRNVREVYFPQPTLYVFVYLFSPRTCHLTFSNIRIAACQFNFVRSYWKSNPCPFVHKFGILWREWFFIVFKYF